MAAAAILDFVGSQIWWQKCFRDPILNPCVKCGASTCNSGRVIKISSKLQNGVCPPSWITICYAGPPTKTIWWREACVQISYQSNQYFWSYRHLKFSQIWLKTPIHAPKIFVFGGFWPPNMNFDHRDPQKALPWPKTRVLTPHASQSVQRYGQDSVRRIQKKKGRTKVVTNWVFAPPTPLMRSLPYLACWVVPRTCFLNFSFRTIGPLLSELWGVKIRPFPLTWRIAYTTACCCRTSRDMYVVKTFYTHLSCLDVVLAVTSC